ncbi:MAG: alpha/beta hydrolase [Chlorobium sp.]|jgi:pimeloyl-ACP methyl ester carboxylesterase|uniref:alpha/beta fold hydrolase n=1 Tax=Chlorobium sp. TaxID=1095 RepID=UPI0025C55128|nr:alpha/beta hydrolase [Chlorobium sp.]MCF8215855.1 alpha/beta hydrolase [Chlorobium sp.]MCF8270753.1 alpha/beta hydrolase [Chlorobium sp.]MCF8287065.1 alpha/beta hydrolase [Chlorobium sp.]MCF8290722.1 alpha/beta hydrolase [Chlorobium sp.]MCF8384826.1 alpha/beta hydrolase [Chlorobium sp.]
MREHEYVQGVPLSSEQRFIDIDGLQLHCRIKDGGAPTLMLLHGSFLSMRSWRLVFDTLAKRSMVIAIDRPAFGSTSRPSPVTGKLNPYSPEGQADLVPELLDRLGIPDAVLVGNSTGGTIALLAAMRHPDRVSGLVLADPMVYSGYATSEFPHWLYPVFRAAAPVGGVFAKLMIRMAFGKLHRTFLHNESLLEKELFEGYRSDFMQGNWGRAFWELLLGSHNLSLDRRLGKLRVPTLVITGDHDRMVKPDETIRLAQELPGAELHIFPHCGHLPQEEKPHLFIKEVNSFLDKHFST